MQFDRFLKSFVPNFDPTSSANLLRFQDIEWMMDFSPSIFKLFMELPLDEDLNSLQQEFWLDSLRMKVESTGFLLTPNLPGLPMLTKVVSKPGQAQWYENCNQ